MSSFHFRECPFDMELVTFFFCFLFLLKDYYKILEVDYDATEDLIRLNYRKLALVCESLLEYVAIAFRLKQVMFFFC